MAICGKVGIGTLSVESELESSFKLLGLDSELECLMLEESESNILTNWNRFQPLAVSKEINGVRTL